MKRLAVGIAFFAVLFSLACAEGTVSQLTDDATISLTKLVIAMLASFAAGLLVSLGYKRK